MKHNVFGYDFVARKSEGFSDNEIDLNLIIFSLYCSIAAMNYSQCYLLFFQSKTINSIYSIDSFEILNVIILLVMQKSGDIK